MIIDSHVHISITTKKGNFINAKQKLLREMAKNKVTQAIVIPDNVSGSQCADINMVIKLTKNEPELSMVATLKIDAIDNKSINKIKNMFLRKQALGFKIFPGHDPIYPTDKRWLPMFRLCQQYNLPLIIHTGINSNNKLVAKYNDPKHIIEIAKKYPKLKIVISHYFWPRLDYCFKITDGLKNIYFDTSALADPEVIKKSGGLKKIGKILTKTIQRRPDSVLFGTDWPIGDIKKHIALIHSLSISKPEQDNIFSGNAKDVFKLVK